jgi:hypothetical protein
MTRPSRSPHVAELWGVSATSFLTLAIWLGPHRAAFFITVAALLWGFAALCRRFPVVGAFMILVVCNRIGGRR